MNHLYYRITLLFILSISFSGCKNYSLRRDMKEFMQRKIEFPSELIKYSEGHVADGTIDVNKPTLVIFYGKDVCIGCAINQLFELVSGIEEIVQTGECDAAVLFSPDVDNILELQEELQKAKITLPIYVDQFGDFYRLNSDFPKAAVFHNFLLDTNKHPVFIGNPLGSDELMAVFKRTLDRL